MEGYRDRQPRCSAAVDEVTARSRKQSGARGAAQPWPARAWRPAVLALMLAGLPAARALADIRYEAKIVGAGNSQLGDLLDDVSQLKSLEDRKPASLEALRRRAARDLPRLSEAAHSLGYWEARFAYRIDERAKPVAVTVTVKEGPRYRVASVTVLGPAGRPLAVPLTKPPALKPGDPAETAPVVATENQYLAALGHNGHPFAKALDRRVVIDRGKKTMAVTYRLDPGPRMRFGPAAIDGLTWLDPGYVERRVKWRPGAVYDNEKVAETRRALIDSGLFAVVKITPLRDPAEPQRVRMRIALSERAHHTIGAGAAYNTSEGAGVRAFWENRDLFGNAERLRLSLGIGQQRDSARAQFGRPDFLATDQDLLALAEIANETPTAYRSRRAQIAAGLQRHFTAHLTGGISLSLEKANVVQLAQPTQFSAGARTQHYALAGLPLYLAYDDTDSLLNPTRGYRIKFQIVPYQSFSGPDLAFASGRLAASAYRRIGDSDRYVIALFGALTSLEGPSLARIPADKRIYAGGGGSIRAYGYEMAGPLDFDKKPIGGKSALELSLEARIKITDTIGIVPFVDAGSYYETSLPHPFTRRLLWGPGIGVRYYTSFGPIRLDLATPMNRRHGDFPLQVYISLGQAF
jgi:translocation and assembly module TamA